MKAHGISSMLIYPLSADELLVKNGVVEADLSRVDTYMEVYKKVGMQGPIVLDIQTLYTDLSLILCHGEDGDDGQLAEAFKKIVGQLSELAKSSNWPEVIFHVVDEPANSEEKRHRAVKLYRLLKEVGCRTFTNADVVFCNQVLDPWLDVRCYNSDFVGKTADQCAERAKETRESNDAFWWYGSGCYTGQEGNMARNRYLVGALFWKSGASGQWSWTFQRPQGDPFNDFDGAEKDACITYPGADRSDIVPTLQWEGIREGIDDARYIYTLETSIYRALLSSEETVRARAREIQLELDDLVGNIPWLYESEYSNREANEQRWLIAQRITELMGSYRE